MSNSVPLENSLKESSFSVNISYVAATGVRVAATAVGERVVQWEHDEMYYEDDEDDEDDDGLDLTSKPPITSFLNLDLSLTVSALHELKEIADKDVSVSIVYQDAAGKPVFYHQFNCSGSILDHIAGNAKSADPLMVVLCLGCISATKFLPPVHNTETLQ